MKFTCQIHVWDKPANELKETRYANYDKAWRSK